MRRRRRRPRVRGPVVLAASGGGHFDMLTAIAPAIDGERQWLTVEGPRSASVSATGETVHTVPTFDLDHFNLANPLASLALALRLRPRLVVTTGAGVVFSFTFCAWLLGADVVFVETMARVTSPSKTGAALARLAALHVVQWPELTERFPRAQLCRPALLPEQVELSGGGNGSFVSLGTHPAGFDRLIEMVDDAVGSGTMPVPCVVQGPRTRAGRPLTYVGTLSPEDFADHIARSRVIVGHSGAGFISTALAHGHRPIVLPRLSAHGEHVDDHQVELTRKLSDLGLVVSAESGIRPESIAAAAAPLDYADVFRGLPAATDVIRAFVEGR